MAERELRASHVENIEAGLQRLQALLGLMVEQSGKTLMEQPFRQPESRSLFFREGDARVGRAPHLGTQAAVLVHPAGVAQGVRQTKRMFQGAGHVDRLPNTGPA